MNAHAVHLHEQRVRLPGHGHLRLLPRAAGARVHAATRGVLLVLPGRGSGVLGQQRRAELHAATRGLEGGAPHLTGSSPDRHGPQETARRPVETQGREAAGRGVGPVWQPTHLQRAVPRLAELGNSRGQRAILVRSTFNLQPAEENLQPAEENLLTC